MTRTGCEFEGKRVLITGAAGFIGSRLLKDLLESRAEVVAFVDEESSLIRIQSLLDHPRLHLVRYPTTDIETLANDRQQWGNIDSLAHLGLRVPHKNSFPDQAVADITLNLLPTLDLLRILGHVGSICFASSVAVYGRPVHLPVQEDDLPAPISSYGVTKLAIENYLRAYGEANQTPVTILRYATVYGPGELSHRAIPNFLNSLSKGQPPLIYGDGSETRDYVYVDDVVQATARALLRKPIQVMNIGSGQGYTSQHIAQEVARLYSADVMPKYLPRESEDISLVCNISLARQVLGYVPKTSLEEGLSNEIEWYRRDGINLSSAGEHEDRTWKAIIKT
jgi:UDP-glucose 4-epimerase